MTRRTPSRRAIARKRPGAGRAPVPRRLRQRAPRLAPEERRAQIVASAIRVLARRGLGVATQTDVAREAGVSLPAVFVYFRTHELLIGAVLEEVAALYLGLATQYLRADVPAPRAALDFARAFAASVDAQPDHARVWFDWSTAIRGDLWPRYLAFQEQIVSALASTIARGQCEGSVAADVDAEDEAWLLVGAAYIVTQMKFGGAPAARVERFVETLVRSAVGRFAGEGAAAAVPRSTRTRS
jgi:TetR/AcrR family hemagglutinin/protease transcriptional regulator